MINIKINDRIFGFPSGWDELSQEELLFFCTKILRKESLHLIKISLALLMLKLRIVKKDSLVIDDVEYFTVIDEGRNMFNISTLAIDQVCDKLGFLITEKEEKEGVKPVLAASELTRNLLPEINLAHTEFTGPKQGLSDISFHQFILAEHYYHKYVREENVEFLDKLIAVLYPKKGEAFNESDVAANAALLAAMAASRKMAVRLFYEGSKWFLAKKFPLVWGGKGKGSANVVDGYMKVINALSGNDVTKHDVIRATALYEVMYALNDLIDKNEKTKV